MTDRIDHAAEARVLEKNAWARGGIDGGLLIRRPEERHDMITSAQVHATLALVEQQRIANLIAYASHRLEHKSAVGQGYGTALSALLAGADIAIREGLGL